MLTLILQNPPLHLQLLLRSCCLLLLMLLLLLFILLLILLILNWNLIIHIQVSVHDLSLVLIHILLVLILVKMFLLVLVVLINLLKWDRLHKWRGQMGCRHHRLWSEVILLLPRVIIQHKWLSRSGNGARLHLSVVKRTVKERRLIILVVIPEVTDLVWNRHFINLMGLGR